MSDNITSHHARRNNSRRLSCLLTLLLAGCSVTTPAMRDRTVEAQRFEQIVSVLAGPAMEGRDAGTAGLARARDYIVGQFRAAGLQPAFTDSYAQPFELDLGAEAIVQRLEVYDGDDQIIEQPAVGRFHSVLGLSADATFAGSAVFVGYAGENDEHDYHADPDVSADALVGKVAIAFRYEPMDEHGTSLWTKRRGGWTETAHFIRKADWAAERGAVALIVVNPPQKPMHGPLRSTAGTMQSPRASIPVYHVRSSWVERLLAAAGLAPVQTLDAWQQQANRAAMRPQALPAIRMEGQVQIQTHQTTVENVAAVAPGAGYLADQVVIIGAHYDHIGYGDDGERAAASIHPGADDNASGVAALLMLANRFARRCVIDGPIEGTPPRRTMLFVAFAAEERGISGSAHLASHLDELGIEQHQIVAMINMDMIGRLRNNELMLFGTGSADRFDELIRTANEQVGLKLRKTPAAGGRSDHVHFHRMRIPTLQAFTGYHEDYHTPDDTIDKINSRGAAKVIDLLDLIAMDLWVQPLPPIYTDVPRDPA